MAAFICPTCKAETNKLIYPRDVENTVCPNCYECRNMSNPNLHQTADSWVDAKGIKHRMTTGKQWEIDNRTLSKDGDMRVINRWTGKNAEY